MSTLWNTRYEELSEFIKEKPQVVIKEDSVSIDEAVRRDFYKKFNSTRSSFLAEYYSDWLDEAQFLSTKYSRVEGALRQRLQLESILMPVSLRRFLSDPINEVTRELFDPLFELLQEKIEPEEFEIKAHENLRDSFRKLYQTGYINWFVLSLMEKIEPEALFSVLLPEPSSKQIIKHRDEVREHVPTPSPTRTLGFGVERREIVLVPDFIVHSARLGKYVAFRTSLGKAIWKASYYSENRNWFSIADMIDSYGVSELQPDLLLYTGEDLEDLSLVADAEQFCRPDMALFFTDQLTGEECLVKEKIDDVKIAHEILKPSKGSVVIARDHLPPEAIKDLDRHTEVIHFGFNNLKWETMLHLLEV